MLPHALRGNCACKGDTKRVKHELAAGTGTGTLELAIWKWGNWSNIHKKKDIRHEFVPQHAPAAAAAAVQTRSSSSKRERGGAAGALRRHYLPSPAPPPAGQSVTKLSAAPFSPSQHALLQFMLLFSLFPLFSFLLFCFAVLQLPFWPLSSSARPVWPWQRTSASASSSPAQNRQLNCTTFRGGQREREGNSTKAGHHYHYQDHYLLQSTLLTP